MFRLSVVAVVASVLAGCIAVSPDEEAGMPSVVARAPQGVDWAQGATLAGFSVSRDMSDSELATALNDFVNQHVSVVECDSQLSEYLDDETFDRELALMRRVVALASERHLKIVWYYPSLEVLTLGGETGSSSMAKDHPDWMQLSADGTPNVFYGSKVFWVEPGAESAWMSPFSPYREYFLSRAERIVGTGVDGLWVDVPLFNDIVGKWPSFNPYDVAAFETQTGLVMPEVPADGSLDVTDSTVRAWLAWRHEAMDDFLKDIHARLTTARADFHVIVETVTMDYNAALLEGLDGAFQGDLAGFGHVWEVDVLSDSTAMQNASVDDFMALVAMYKFGRGADVGHPAWAFTYGLEPDDAEAVMAICLAAGVSPYELKVPEMTTTVGAEYRTRQFGWIEANAEALLGSESQARVLLLHSSASRDVIDARCITAGDCGVSLFSTWQSPDPSIAWWTTGKGDGVAASDYMAEYRGAVKALVASRTPFDLLPSRLLTRPLLDRYDVVLAPAFEAASDAEIALLRGFVERGGRVMFTGVTPALSDERGGVRATPGFADVVTPNATCSEQPYGAGFFQSCSVWVTRKVLGDTDAAAMTIVEAAVAHAEPTLQVQGEGQLLAEIRTLKDRRFVHLANFSGADGSFTVEPRTVAVSVWVGEDAEIGPVSATSPERPIPEVLATIRDGGWVRFSVDVRIQRLIEVSVE